MRGMARLPDSAPLAVAHAQLANRVRNWSLALERWDAVEARFSPSVATLLGRIRALRGAGETPTEAVLDSARAMLSTALSNGSDTSAERWLAFEIARAESDAAGVRAAVASLIEIAHDAGPFVGLAHACWEVGDLATAEKTATLALAAAPDSVGALNILAQLAVERADGETAIMHYRKLLELQPNALPWLMKYGQLLYWMGRIIEATEVFEVLHRRWREHPSLRRLLRAQLADGFPAAFEEALREKPGGAGESEAERQMRGIDSHAPTEGLLRSPLIQDPKREILVGRLRNAESAVLVFTASNDSVSIPLRSFDRFMASLPVSVVYLKDFQRLRFMNGVRSLASDYRGTVEALRKLLAGLGAKRLVTMGHCVGGTAALCYGVDLGAERAIAFDPLPDAGGDPEIDSAYAFHRKRFVANVRPPMCDLNLFLGARHHQTAIQLHCRTSDEGPNNRSLALSSMPGVTLFCHSGVSGVHLLRHLAHSSDDFGEMLAELIGVSRIKAPA
jgi:tetratricopeptide (TPR) repeat protein